MDKKTQRNLKLTTIRMRALSRRCMDELDKSALPMERLYPKKRGCKFAGDGMGQAVFSFNPVQEPGVGNVIKEMLAILNDQKKELETIKQRMAWL